MICGLVSFAQDKSDSPVVVVRQIFENYIKYQESPDSQENKTRMASALKSLQTTSDTSDFQLLINVWMYYQATDFPTKDLIYPIFEKNRIAAVNAIKWRLQNRKEWESDEGLKDLVYLKDKLSK